jgi:hypothetical protein
MDLSKKIEVLFERYLQNKCAPDELELLYEYFEAAENETTLKQLILAEIASPQFINSDTVAPETKRKLEKILKKMMKDIC